MRYGTTDVAVKVLKLEAASEAGARQARKEIAILRAVSFHRNVVQFFGACLTDPAMLVMEYMSVRVYITHAAGGSPLIKRYTAVMKAEGWNP